MYQMRCTRPEVEAKCKRLSCVHPNDLQAAGDRPRPARRPDAQSRDGARHRKVLVASRHPHGPGPAVARVPARAGRASRRRAPEGGARSTPIPNVLRLMKKPDVDNFEGFAAAFKEASTPRRQEAIPRALFHRVAPRQRPERDDRPGGCSSSATATVPTRCRTSSRPRSTSPRACTTRASTRSPARKSTSPRTCGTGRCSGRCCSSSSPRTTSMVREALLEGGAGGPDRQRVRLPDPGPAAQGRHRGTAARANEVAEGDHYHSIANPAKGEPVVSGAAESGLPTEAEEDGPPPGQEASTGRRRPRPEFVADCSRPRQAPSRASPDLRGAAGTRRHDLRVDALDDEPLTDSRNDPQASSGRHRGVLIGMPRRGHSWPGEDAGIRRSAATLPAATGGLRTRPAPAAAKVAPVPVSAALRVHEVRAVRTP